MQAPGVTEDPSILSKLISIIFSQEPEQKQPRGLMDTYQGTPAQFINQAPRNITNALYEGATGYPKRDWQIANALMASQAMMPGAMTASKAVVPWRSKLQETIGAKMPNAMPSTALAQQVRGWRLPGEGPATQEQIDWSGLPEWLAEKGGKVTKDEVQKYLKETDLRFEEVVKGRNTKFSQYQLPGGENYRELLITITEDVRDKSLRGKSKAQIAAIRMNRGATGGYHDLGYVSPHYDEPNILAHVRFNDRTGPNGEKVLFIEELQSDWHQAGRKKGYKGKREQELIRKGQIGEQTEAEAEELALLFDVVPDAPWKKTWPLKAFQRMVRYAAENGYDSISWTPGEVQAERYDLSKHIDRLDYIKNHDGTYTLNTWKGSRPIEELNSKLHEIPEDEIENYIGKEVAEKIIGHKGIDASNMYDAEFAGTLPSIDLKVGGEGMKGFYDKILPAEVNKFFNKAKWGKAKVRTEGIDTGREFMGKGTGRWEIVSKESGREEIIKTVEDRQEARDFAKTLRHSNWVVREEQKTKGQEVWTLPITPEMKSKALGEGFWSSQREKPGLMGAYA